MAGAASLEAVKRKIKSLQEQADVAEQRAERLQKELILQKKAREQVSTFTHAKPQPEPKAKPEPEAPQPARVSALICEEIRSEIAGFSTRPPALL